MESQLSLQISQVAAECSTEKRLEYIGQISAYEPRQLVFVDESSVDCRTMYCGWAWSIRGTKAQRKAFFVRGRWYVITQFYQPFPYIHLVSQYFLQYHWRMAFCTVKLWKDPFMPTHLHCSYRISLNICSCFLHQTQLLLWIIVVFTKTLSFRSSLQHGMWADKLIFYYWWSIH